MVVDKNKVAICVFDVHGKYDMEANNIGELPVLLVIGANQKKVRKLIDSYGVPEYKIQTIRRLLEKDGLIVKRIPKGNTEFYTYLNKGE